MARPLGLVDDDAAGVTTSWPPEGANQPHPRVVEVNPGRLDKPDREWIVWEEAAEAEAACGFVGREGEPWAREWFRLRVLCSGRAPRVSLGCPPV